MVSLTSVAVVESAAGEATSTAGSPGGSITRTNYQLAASDRTNRYLAFDEQEVAPAAMSRLSDAERARPVEISRRWRTSLAQLAASIGLLESNEQWPPAPCHCQGEECSHVGHFGQSDVGDGRRPRWGR